jgi:hypothetical protein
MSQQVCASKLSWPISVFSRISEENYENSVRIINVTAEIRIGKLNNTKKHKSYFLSNRTPLLLFFILFFVH